MNQITNMMNMRRKLNQNKLSRMVFALLLILLTSQLMFAQEERLVTGVLKDAAGEPLPGVNIVVDGTNTGTVTDANGYYSIKAPLGSVLIYNFIGFVSEKVTVTIENSKPCKGANVKQTKNQTKLRNSYAPLTKNDDTRDTIKEEGTAYFTNTTPSFKMLYKGNNRWNGSIDPGKIDKIQFDNQNVKVSIGTDKYIRIPRITFISSIAFDQPNRLPRLQNKFSQGQSEAGVLQWKGPETGQIFSWGEEIQNLEFDGSEYNFDKNGRLVAKGTGNGIPAKTYNPYHFFKTGTSLVNLIKINRKDEKRSYNLTWNNSLTAGIVPNASKTSNAATIELERTWRSFKIGYNFFFEKTHSSLLSNTPSNNLFMASILTTPSTFDNANGMSSKKAATNSSAYLLPNGDQRSSSVDNNNPYWLINNLPDKENSSAFNNSLMIQATLVKNLILKIQPGFQLQTCRNIFGLPYLTAGTNNYRLTERIDKLQSFHNVAILSYDFSDYNYRFTLHNSLNFDYHKSKRVLQRKDTYLTVEGLNDDNDSAFRSESYLYHRLNFTYKNIILFNAINGISKSSAYFKHQIQYNPYISGGLNFGELLARNYNWFFNLLKLRTSWGYNYAEVPLLFTMGSYNYQHLSSGEFAQAYFNHEITSGSQLTPEKIRKLNFGLDISVLNNIINLSVDYYQNKSTNCILPIAENNNVVLKNLANSKTHGVDATLCFQKYFRCERYFTFRIVFSQSRSIVTELYDNLPEVALGGYTNAHTALIKGEPYGVIAGTAYQRNEKGELIIGTNGYPLVDSKLKVLGNPNPDYRLGFEFTLKFKTLTFNLLTELSKGGKVWNGTENTLSYLGMSKKTEEGRIITGYIYPGVTEDGIPNTMSVNFADPTLSMDANRWVKYGPNGVAEDAIQEASWFRIREVSISYTPARMLRKNFPLEISLFAKNLLLSSKYSGIDPETALWGMSNTKGLDMFNMPGLANYGLALKIML
jgi:hypothetical protein